MQTDCQCSTCFFAEQEKGGQLVCCRYPPTPAMIPTRNPLTGEVQPATIAMRAAVQETWYCGEYSPQEGLDKPQTSVIQGG